MAVLADVSYLLFGDLLICLKEVVRGYLQPQEPRSPRLRHRRMDVRVCRASNSTLPVSINGFHCLPNQSGSCMVVGVWLLLNAMYRPPLLVELLRVKATMREDSDQSGLPACVPCHWMAGGRTNSGCRNSGCRCLQTASLVGLTSFEQSVVKLDGAQLLT